MVKPSAMHASTATISARTKTSGGATPAESIGSVTASETMAPIITTSPWAKLISCMMPYTIV